MPRKNIPLTATDFFRYLQCPHWPYWERFGDPNDRRPLTETEEQRLAEGLEHEKTVVKEMLGDVREVKVRSAAAGYKKTLALMREGVPLIYQGWLVDEDRVGRPDILEKQKGKSAFGDWYYAPIDVKRAHELKKEHKAQLTFYATLLERIQKRFPDETAIINADHERLPFDAKAFLPEYRLILEAIERIREGHLPAPVYRKTCEDTSPWGKACFRLAHEHNDIALLFNVDIRKLEALRRCGVRTVDDAAALKPSELEGCAPGLTLRALESVQRQATSLRDKRIIIREPFQDPTHGLEIHFDIESHPPTDVDYLYGFWIAEPGHEHYLSFVAERPEDEAKMWRNFVHWVATLPESYTVYHYANYEVTRLAILAKRYGDESDPHLARFREHMIDLKEAARDHAVFPLYFYSLKKICQHLGFAWEGDVKGGGESVVAYEKWLKTKRRSILESILQYNEEDVRATAFLLRWLKAYAKKGQSYIQPYPWAKKT